MAVCERIMGRTWLFINEKTGHFPPDHYFKVERQIRKEKYSL